jgi:hypothetical protein
MIFNYDLLSYWLFIWFLLYYFKLINASPLIFFIVALIGLIFFQLFIVKKIKYKYMFKNIFIKLIPCILIFKFPIIEEIDLIFGFILIYIYIIVLLINNKNPIDIYLKILKNN